MPIARRRTWPWSALALLAPALVALGLVGACDREEGDRRDTSRAVTPTETGGEGSDAAERTRAAGGGAEVAGLPRSISPRVCTS